MDIYATSGLLSAYPPTPFGSYLGGDCLSYIFLCGHCNSKAGDGVVDVQLIADLHKSEVFIIAKHLGVHDSIVVAPPRYSPSLVVASL